MQLSVFGGFQHLIIHKLLVGVQGFVWDFYCQVCLSLSLSLCLSLSFYVSLSLCLSLSQSISPFKFSLQSLYLSTQSLALSLSLYLSLSLSHCLFLTLPVSLSTLSLFLFFLSHYLSLNYCWTSTFIYDYNFILVFETWLKLTWWFSSSSVLCLQWGRLVIVHTVFQDFRFVVSYFLFIQKL